MVGEQNIRLSGVQFHHGIDATAELLNAVQQYVSTELTERTKDFIRNTGFAWGLKIGRIDGQSITITQGVAFDQYGTRLYHSSDASYKLAFPATATNTGYLCMKAYPKNVLYKIHPYDGTRHPVETVIGIQFYVDTAVYTDPETNVYPSSGEGLVVAKLTVSGATYDWKDYNTATEHNRSPNLKLRDGS